MTYLLILYILIGGQWNAEVLDSGLTWEDCAAALSQSTPDRPLGCDPDLDKGI